MLGNALFATASVGLTGLGSRAGTVLLYQDECWPAYANFRPEARADGWRWVTVDTFEQFRRVASVRTFDVVVLRGTTPGWCRRALSAVRLGESTPVVAMVPEMDESVQGWLLDQGAGLVLDANCDTALLRSAVRAVARGSLSPRRSPRYLEADELVVDLLSRQVFLDGRPVSLSHTEFELLGFLMGRALTVVTHHEIAKTVLNRTARDAGNALRLHISRLRARLPGGRTPLIQSVRGVGYMFCAPVTVLADNQEQRVVPTRSDLVAHGALQRVKQLLLRSRDRADASETLAETVVADGLCDAAAVFARMGHGDVLHLVAQAGNPPEWTVAAARGVPIGFTSLAREEAFHNGSPQELSHIAITERRRIVTDLLRHTPSYFAVPLSDENGIWGQLGFGRRSDSAFTSEQRAVLEAAGHLLGILHGRHAVRA